MGLFSGTQGGQMMMVGPVMPQTQALLPPPEIVNLSNVRQRQGQYGTQVSKQKESMSGVKVKALPNEQALLEVEEYKLRNKKAEIDNLAYQYFIGPMNSDLKAFKDDSTIKEIYSGYYNDMAELERNKIIANDKRKDYEANYAQMREDKAFGDAVIDSEGNITTNEELLSRSYSSAKLGKKFQFIETQKRGVFKKGLNDIMKTASGAITDSMSEYKNAIVSGNIEALKYAADNIYSLLGSQDPDALRQGRSMFLESGSKIKNKRGEWVNAKPTEANFKQWVMQAALEQVPARFDYKLKGVPEGMVISGDKFERMKPSEAPGYMQLIESGDIEPQKEQRNIVGKDKKGNYKYMPSSLKVYGSLNPNLLAEVNAGFGNAIASGRGVKVGELLPDVAYTVNGEVIDLGLFKRDPEGAYIVAMEPIMVENFIAQEVTDKKGDKTFELMTDEERAADKRDSRVLCTRYIIAVKHERNKLWGAFGSDPVDRTFHKFKIHTGSLQLESMPEGYGEEVKINVGGVESTYRLIKLDIPNEDMAVGTYDSKSYHKSFFAGQVNETRRLIAEDAAKQKNIKRIAETK